MKEFILSLKGYLKAIDWLLFTFCIFTSGFGVVMISSATKSFETNKYVIVQCAVILMGIFLYFFFSAFDLAHLAVFWKVLFVMGVLLILSGLVFGRSAGGNRSWIEIPLGSFKIGLQPGELVKVFFIVTISKHISDIGPDLNKLKNLLLVCVHFGIYAGLLVFVSKDDGMTIMYMIIFVAILFAAGIKLRYMLIGAGTFIAALPFVWQYVLSDYQRTRVLVVFDPTLSLDTVGYQAYQSKMAIRSGGILGQGLYNGTMTQYGQLPVKQSDFIFAVTCEELGLIGGLAVILLVSVIAARCMMTAYKVRHDKFSYLVCVGVASMIFFQLILNVGMCLGVIPVIGLTLPFFSYGGTSMLTMFMAVGIVCSLGMHVRPTLYKNESV